MSNPVASAPTSGGSAQSGPPVSSAASANAADEFTQLWNKALSEYMAKTKIDPSKHPLSTLLTGHESPEDMCDVYQNNMKEFRASNSKWGMIRNTYVKPIVEALIIINETVGETAALFPVIPGGKTIFVAFGVLLAATKRVSERYDALKALLEEIKFFFGSLRLRATSTASWGHLSRNIASLILAHVLDVFALATKFLADIDRPWARLSHYGQSLINKKDMQGSLQRLRSLTSLESRAITSETRVDVAECLKIAEQLQLEVGAMKLAQSHDLLSLGIMERSVNDHIQKLVRTTDELRETVLTAAEDAEARDLLAGLDRVGLAELSAQRRGGCLEGTCVDVLEILYSWSSDPNAPRIYWLNGMAGTGKSSIARSFALKLQDNGILGGSYFCSRESLVELTDTNRILPTLAVALAGFDTKYKSALISTLKKYSKEARPSTWALKLQIERLFVEPFLPRATVSPTAVLVIDALDEAKDDTIGDLLDVLVSVAPQLPIKFFLTSRPERHIRWRLDSLEDSALLRLHDIEATVVKDDIRCYIVHRFKRMLKRFKPPASLPESWPNDSDVESLVEQSGSLFIYAFTTTEYIGGSNPVKRLQDVIRVGDQSGLTMSPLDDLDRIYQFILSAATINRPPDELALTKRILTAILAARELLSLKSLARLLGLRVYEITIALDELHAVINVPKDEDSESLSTLHASFGDYLTERGRAQDGMLVSIPEGHDDLTVGCLTALLSDDLHFNMSGARTSYLPNVRQDLSDIPVHLQYACRHWLQHIVAVGTPSSVVMNDMKEFLSSKLFFWFECCSALGATLYGIRGCIGTFCGHLEGSTSPEILDLKALLTDISGLLDSMSIGMEESAPHVYLSAVPFMQFFPRLAEAYRDTFSQLASPNYQWLHEDLRGEGLRLVACSPDDIHISAVSGDCTIYIWDRQTGVLKTKFNGSVHGREDRLVVMVFSSDGTYLLTATKTCGISIWDVTTWECSRRLKGNTHDIAAMAFSPNREYLGVLQSAVSDTDWHISVWRLPHSADEELQLMNTLHFPPHIKNVVPFILEFSPSGNYVTIGTNKSDLFIWDIRSSESCLHLSSEMFGEGLMNTPIYGITFVSESEIILALLCDSHAVYLLSLNDTLTGSLPDSPPRACFRRPVGTDYTSGPSALFEDEFVVTLFRDALLVWDLHTGSCVRNELQGHMNYVDFVSVSSDGKFIISGSSSGNIDKDYPVDETSIIVWDIDPTSDRCKAAMSIEFEHFYLPCEDSGWLRGPNQELLLYIPEEYRPYVQHPPVIHRFGAGRLTIDWTNAVHGEDWTKCYVGPK